MLSILSVARDFGTFGVGARGSQRDRASLERAATAPFLLGYPAQRRSRDCSALLELKAGVQHGGDLARRTLPRECRRPLLWRPSRQWRRSRIRNPDPMAQLVRSLAES